MPEFVMPKPCLGETVLWMEDISSRRPAPALVCAVGERAVDVVLPGGKVISGAHHESDPEPRFRTHEAGYWRLTVLGELLRELDSALSDGKLWKVKEAT